MLFQYETKRLILRILNPAEADKVLDFYMRDLALFEKYEFARVPDFYTTEFQQKTLRYEYNTALKMTTIRFYVFRKENPEQIIGTVCLHDIWRSFYQSFEIGYKFSSEFHHQGYATEALICALRIGFNDLQLHRCNAMVCVGNEPSRKLLNRLGFTEEGICQDYLFLNNKWEDHYQYGLIANNFKF